MDAVMDITARAVSFISLIQETFIRAAPLEPDNNLPRCTAGVFPTDFSKAFHVSLSYIEMDELMSCKLVEGEEQINSARAAADMPESFDVKSFTTKVIDLVWVVDRKPTGDEKKLIKNYAVELCTRLIEWINHQDAIVTFLDKDGMFASAQKWRTAISRELYAHTIKRVELAQVLEYIPIHVLLAMYGDEYDAWEQRILQWWNTHSYKNWLPFGAPEKKVQESFQKRFVKCFQLTDDQLTESPISMQISKKIALYLQHYKQLTEQLIAVGAPLPFEYVFNLEVDEVLTSRHYRIKEQGMVDATAVVDPTSPNGNGNIGTLYNANGENIQQNENESCDPFERGKLHGLTAIAFSGGGIRSATFNLGLLQGLAKKNILPKFDYLSTVSGGGYIGSWLSTWIKREGSICKINDRLNPLKATDPFGDEVRPIRWLRMYSNYYNPRRSIMSIDAWTIGVTWLRNTLLNQIVIFLVLLSALLLARSAIEVWIRDITWSKQSVARMVYVTSSALLVLVALLTGIGMQWFDRKRISRLSQYLHQHINLVTGLIIGIATAGAFVISACFYALDVDQFSQKLLHLWPAAAIVLSVLLLIAVLGRYDRCLNFKERPAYAISMLVGSAAIAAAVGWLGLAAAWQLFDLIENIKMLKPGRPILVHDLVAFTIGMPLILLVFSATVISRMALLGREFPDERREWWGRMGAILHRIAFAWVLICAATFIALEFLQPWVKNLLADPKILVGWIAVVGSALRAAFSAKTSGKENASGLTNILLKGLSEAGPYIFILGLLVIVPKAVQPLMELDLSWLGFYLSPDLRALLFAVLIFALAAGLSWRIGVNEFSMHHFSRNRLMRAYLGATRRKTTRERTRNPFTNLDTLDDEKLCLFTNMQGYCGPYPVINTTLNATQVTELDRQDRKAESFIFSPLFCGFDFSKVRASINSLKKSYDYGYRPTMQYGYGEDKGPGIGTAMAISGAAANPNQGFHSAPGTAFLMTLFNVQMGWWIGNPRKNKWRSSDPEFGLAYVLANLTGNSNTKKKFVCLSDGGHFDNMGLYEMVRRECSFIVLGDGEQDEQFTCEGLANAIRRCRIDFGTEIIIDVAAIVNRTERHSQKHFVVGDIIYHRNQLPGKLVYIKSSITGDEPVDVGEYATKNKQFPHQTTADQFFDEEQFESYRKLGLHIADELWKDKDVVDSFPPTFDLWYRQSGDGVSRDPKDPNSLFKAIKEFFKR